MTKRSWFFNNLSPRPLPIPELDVVLPKGVSNLFELKPELEYDQIQRSVNNGTLRAAMESKFCIPVPNPINRHSYDERVILRNPSEIQVLPSRVRFTAPITQDKSVFNEEDYSALFKDEEEMPARELEEEIQKESNTEKIEATIKAANLPEKPIDARYTPKQERQPIDRQKLKNDITMKYETCSGITAAGTRCLRQAKKGKRYCGKHIPTTQED